MKKILLFAFSISTFFSYGQNKINLLGLQELKKFNTELVAKSSNSVVKTIEAIIIMNKGWSEDDLERYGASIVLKTGKNLVVADIPVDSVTSLSANKFVKYVSFGEEFSAKLDFAIPASNVTQLHQGFDFDGQTMTFDGTGIVTGLMDQGIDPNHPMFLDESGASRVKEAIHYGGSSALTPNAVRRFTTDDSNATHGTHVAGIMAGRAYEEGEYSYISTPTGRNSSLKEGGIPFIGVATGSDIVMTAGSFSSANILKGVNEVIEYASSVNKPCVVNLSLGSNNGPHDGTGALQEGLAELGEKGIICISAGNEGDMNIFVGKSFTKNDTQLKTFIADNSSNGIDIWGNDNRPVKVTLAFYNAGDIVELASIDDINQSSSPNASVFGSYMNGTFALTSEVNPLNNRFHVLVSGNFTQKNAGRQVVLIVEGSAGQQVYCYGYGNPATQFSSNSIKGYETGTNNGSISDTATGENVIAIGSYTTRTTWGTFAGTYLYSDPAFSVGEVSPFSSFGETFKGVKLPRICAPGANIQSSLNRYYTSGLGVSERNSSTSAVVKGKSLDAYWGAMQGTSMSCPYASGVVALWLQADPTLSCQDVIDIMEKSAVDPFEGSLNVSAAKRIQWGAGKLDALAGIKEVLERKNAGVQGVLADVADELIVKPVDSRVWELSVASASNITARLFNMQGISVASKTVNDSQLTLDASHVAPGVYVLVVETPNTGRLTRRLFVK